MDAFCLAAPPPASESGSARGDLPGEFPAVLAAASAQAQNPTIRCMVQKAATEPMAYATGVRISDSECHGP